VVAHALDLADRPPDGPLTPDERADETQTRTRQCDAVTADGRRCAAAAETLDDLEQCIADHDRTNAEDAEGVEDLLKNPFAPRP
jgi:hypothetical protein